MTTAVQSAMSHALQHVPLTNGATAGPSDQVPVHAWALCLAFVADVGTDSASYSYLVACGML